MSTVSADQFLPGAAGGAVFCQRICIGSSTAYDNVSNSTNTGILVGAGIGSKNKSSPKMGGLISAGATIKIYDFEK